jgi:hypothetical protein
MFKTDLENVLYPLMFFGSIFAFIGMGTVGYWIYYLLTHMSIALTF